MPVDEVLQGRSGEQLHDQPGHGVVGAEVEHGHDIRVGQARQELRLAAKPLHRGLRRLFDVEQLHRDVAIEQFVVRAIDSAHAAAAQDGPEAVAPGKNLGAVPQLRFFLAGTRESLASSGRSERPVISTNRRPMPSRHAAEGCISVCHV